MLIEERRQAHKMEVQSNDEMLVSTGGKTGGIPNNESDKVCHIEMLPTPSMTPNLQSPRLMNRFYRSMRRRESCTSEVNSGKSCDESMLQHIDLIKGSFDSDQKW